MAFDLSSHASTVAKTLGAVSLQRLAAHLDINKTNINLVGLAQTGLAYMPFEG